MKSQRSFLQRKVRRIQRLTKPENSLSAAFSFGTGGLTNGGISRKANDILAQVFSFDYMGNSHFEWGAVPDAIQFLLSQTRVRHRIFFRKNLLVSGEHRGVYYITPQFYEDGVKALIDVLLTNERDLMLMEPCGLSLKFKKVKSEQWVPYENVCGWLELDNGFFFFTDKEMFEGTKALFGVK